MTTSSIPGGRIVYPTETVLSAANTVADGVKYLNHATRAPRDGEYVLAPGDVDAVLVSLRQAIGSLPQTLTQLAELVERNADRPGFVADRERRDLAASQGVVRATRGLLGSAAGDLQRVYRDLGILLRYTGRMVIDGDDT